MSDGRNHSEAAFIDECRTTQDKMSFSDIARNRSASRVDGFILPRATSFRSRPSSSASSNSSSVMKPFAYKFGIEFCASRPRVSANNSLAISAAVDRTFAHISIITPLGLASKTVSLTRVCSATTCAASFAASEAGTCILAAAGINDSRSWENSDDAPRISSFVMRRRRAIHCSRNSNANIRTTMGHATAFKISADDVIEISTSFNRNVGESMRIPLLGAFARAYRAARHKRQRIVTRRSTDEIASAVA
ncbi:hypothetical protein AWB70_01019 [Caballeronia cordobensis]|uniref:Uncharacterized protein n=1 Tax=Caballeronia cordobensis TaxID=1353886 RepID=A0A158FK13_CABCO|nr:hypothetical protein AWB70_01019 [Caballeronia cordobensis]